MESILVNGGINLSELDGWWAEAYLPDLGWALVFRLSNNYTYSYAAFFRRFFGFVHPGEISSSR